MAAVAIDQNNNIGIMILQVSARVDQPFDAEVYLQMIICRGHKPDLVLQLYHALLQFSSRFCGVGQVEVGIPNLFSQCFVFSP